MDIGLKQDPHEACSGAETLELTLNRTGMLQIVGKEIPG